MSIATQSASYKKGHVMTDAPSLTGDDVRNVVAFFASIPMQMSLEEWQEPSRTLLHAADEIDRLRAELTDLNEGRRVVLPKSKEHAQAMHLGATKLL